MKKFFSFLYFSVITSLLVSCGGSTGDLVGLGAILPNYLNTRVLNNENVKKMGAVAYDVDYLYNSGKLSSVSTSNNSYSYTLDYSGTQITKITRNHNTGTQTDLMVSNLSYSSNQLTQINGAVNSGSALTPFKTDITYTNGKATQVKTQHFASGTTVVTATVTTDLEYAGNNISKITKSEQIGSSPASISVINLSNYDANLNPYRTLPIVFTLANCNWELNSSLGPIGLSSNNYKTATMQSGSESRSISYDTEGYPTESISNVETLKFSYLQL